MQALRGIYSSEPGKFAIQAVGASAGGGLLGYAFTALTGSDTWAEVAAGALAGLVIVLSAHKDNPALKRQATPDKEGIVRLYSSQISLKGGTFKIQEEVTTEAVPGVIFEEPVQERDGLEIPLRTKVEDQRFERLIHWVMHTHLVKKTRALPIHSRITDLNLLTKSPITAPQQLQEYIQAFRFKEMPNCLKIQFKRFRELQDATPASPGVGKDERPALLPSDGVIDLSRYYDAPEGTSLVAKYKIKRIVVHTGDQSNGRFDSYIEVDGKYYQCVDAAYNRFKEITKAEFFGIKTAYSLILERIAA